MLRRVDNRADEDHRPSAKYPCPGGQDADTAAPILEDVEQIRKAAKRAADLTHQLLIFGRGDVPAQTEMSVGLSKELKKRGFNFCGPVIVYAFAQAVGMVNDHLTTCFRHKECASLTRK